MMREQSAARRRVAGEASLLRPLLVPDNPGRLDFLAHVPRALADKPGLVVILHGCRQHARAFDHAAGWTRLAERHGFAVLAPEQRRSNNAWGCFDWFDPEQTRRGEGQVGSVANAVRQTVGKHGLDAGRVFVVGLSAGGGLAGALLAAHPELFAAGAVVAGPPVGVATDGSSARRLMAEASGLSMRELGDRVRAAAPPGFRGPWPRVSVWHGAADDVVALGNARDCVLQWLDAHGATGKAEAGEVDAARRLVRRDARGRAVVESWTVPGLAHGYPLAPGLRGARRGGVPGPWMLDAGVNASWHLASGWGLLRRERPKAPPADPLAWWTPAAALDRALKAWGG
jgi:poly(hydroxyalkanoate) depolymerase family esterase